MPPVMVAASSCQALVNGPRLKSRRQRGTSDFPCSNGCFTGSSECTVVTIHGMVVRHVRRGFMHIKKLEICGFKSFVDRTVVHFDHDVIGIVGPNGCGKSNIVDAIRWCMGEQSAKHLRGKAMEDVIFNGSESPRPARLRRGHAHLRERDPSARRRSRSNTATTPRSPSRAASTATATSEYLINKTQVRLKDITDLFLGTGVGTQGVLDHRAGQDRPDRLGAARGSAHAHRGGRRHHQVQGRKKQAERKMEHDASRTCSASATSSARSSGTSRR